MGRTLVIAELGSSWRFGSDHVGNAERLIKAAAECGTNVVKMQWASDGPAVARRRGLGEDAASMYQKYLEWPKEWMHQFKAFADACGVEWACTVYLPQDIPVIAGLVSRFKISAYESEWEEFLDAFRSYGKQVICSVNPGQRVDFWRNHDTLHCISKYPTPLEELHLAYMRVGDFPGLSDHTTSLLTGALCVAAGGSVVEKHIRLRDTPKDNPDYPHSLIATRLSDPRYHTEDYEFSTYVSNIRTAERCL